MLISYIRKDRHELLVFLEQVYDRIALDDLTFQIQDDEYLKNKAQEDMGHIGDVRDLRVLEIGPGRGVLLSLLREAGAHVFAADLTRHYLEKIDRHGSENYLLDIQDPDGIPVGLIKMFDLVILTDVLEHLVLPADALLNCRDLLKDGGRLYIRVPAHESLISYSQRLACPYPLVHVRSYTKSLLRREIRAAGFTEVSGPRYLNSAQRTPRARFSAGSFWTETRRTLEARGGESNTYSALSLRERFRSALLSGGVNVSRPTVRLIFRIMSIPFTNSSELYCLAERHFSAKECS